MPTYLRLGRSNKRIERVICHGLSALAIIFLYALSTMSTRNSPISNHVSSFRTSNQGRFCENVFGSVGHKMVARKVAAEHVGSVDDEHVLQ